MNRNEIITEIYNDKKYIDYCRKVMNGDDLHKDLFQYVCLYLAEMKETKLLQLHNTGGLRMYIARIIYINAYSQSSQFRKQYESGEDLPAKIVELFEDDEAEMFKDESIKKIKKAIEEAEKESIKNGVYPASAKLFQIYLECGNGREVARRTGIPYITVWKHIEDFKNKIRAKIK